MHALVPDRVPDGIGHGLDVAVAVVEQDDVQVAVRAQRAAPVAPHRQEGQVPVGGADRPIGHAREPLVGLVGVGVAKGLTA